MAMNDQFISVMITPTVGERDDLVSAEIAWGYLSDGKKPMEIKGQVTLAEIVQPLKPEFTDTQDAAYRTRAMANAFFYWVMKYPDGKPPQSYGTDTPAMPKR
jgi:hypothetical protein